LQAPDSQDRSAFVQYAGWYLPDKALQDCRFTPQEDSMPEIVMYTTGMCPYCVRAKMLLQNKGVHWEERRIDHDRVLMREMLERSQRRTVPQIFIDEYHVGGYDDLAEMDAFGKLDPMLGLEHSATLPSHSLDASEDGPT
jgi:glutaredoxin 3